MLKLTGNSVVADELELATLNSVVGMHSSSGRWATYNTPSDGHRRASAHHIVFQARPGSPELNRCSVNSPRGFGMIADWAVLRDHEGILLNYYGPSSLTVPLGRGVSVEIAQRTDYPVGGLVDLAVSPSTEAPFTLKLRIPHWSRDTTVCVNGLAVRDVWPGRYLAIERRWKPGDRIRLGLDMSPHLWSGEHECRDRTSIYRGPRLLAFDHRYNLHLAGEAAPRAIAEECRKPFDRSCMSIPTLDGRSIRGTAAPWSDWPAPLLLLEVPAADGRTVRLCDFASAGEGGTPYVSWLPVIHAPPPRPFDRDRPLRRERVDV